MGKALAVGRTHTACSSIFLKVGKNWPWKSPPTQDRWAGFFNASMPKIIQCVNFQPATLLHSKVLLVRGAPNLRRELQAPMQQGWRERIHKSKSNLGARPSQAIEIRGSCKIAE